VNRRTRSTIDVGPTPRGTARTASGDVYDWWSRHPRALDVLYATAFLGREASFRRRATEALGLAPGERVLEVGCGNGNGFAALRDGVGPAGSVVGLDASEGMATAASDRIRETGWRNVDVLRGDARRPPVAEGTFDAAYAAMSISAVPDPERAVAATRETLRPGGRFVVLDAQPFDRWPWRVLNPVVVPAAEWATDWVPEVDLTSALRREFERVDVSTFNGGSIFLARARKAE
jgi:demethylmenaquinone methyltransferase/2-methoxy-6-polyprenyl-1,4-benzoquinol methylase